ncbi:MAG: MBOAT family protein [Lachnospiraceae bacterium]|nr:MBOAT family protein [Lachnospiraceae bacterium]
MTFNSYLFLFIFMPVTAVIYWKLRKKGHTGASLWFLIFASLIFYGSVSLTGLAVFLFELFLNRLFAAGILKNRENNRKAAGAILTAGIVTELLILILFKYFGRLFIISGFKIEAPGISFYTFCGIMLLTECFREGGMPEKEGIKALSLREHLLYMTFFPKLLQGPIAAPYEMLSQKEGGSSLSFETLYRSLLLFSFGLFKKVILADTLGAAVDFGFTNLNALHTGEALIVMLSYTLQLYFDFSGYCDMASAAAAVFGFSLPLNFRSPYRARNIIDFWKRWHITLTGFFTKYVYIPLGGSRKGKGRTILNILIIFFLSGLWHGSGWNFLIWGMMHGIAFALLRLIGFGNPKKKEKSPERSGKLPEEEGLPGAGTIIKTAFTFLYVNAAWVFFRAPSAKDALHLFSDMGQFWFPRFNYNLAKCFQIPELWYALKLLRIDRLSFGQYVPMALLLLFMTILVFRKKTADDYAKTCRIGAGNTFLMTLLMIWGVLSMTGVQTYLYVNF